MSCRVQSDPNMLQLNVNIRYPIQLLHQLFEAMDQSSDMQNGTCNIQMHLHMIIKEEIMKIVQVK